MLIWNKEELKFRFVLWGVSETSVDNYFTRQYIPEDKPELHTRRRENLKSHKEELPHQWKETTVVPIHKQGDKTDCSNEQGISLLST
jgi:hypothetical protein